MGTGTKVAIGCGVVALLAGVAVVVVVGVGSYWVKGKVEDMAGSLDKMAAKTDEIAAWEKKANAHPYTPSPDGVIAEDRLLGFLEVRKRVYGVYERYRRDLEELQKKSEAAGDKMSPTDLWRAGGKLAEVFSEIRLAQMKALAEVGMNEEEYHAIQLAVYKSAWASQTEKETGQMPAEAVSKSTSEAAQQIEDAMRAGLEAAQKEGAPGASNLSPEDAKKLQEAVTQLGQGTAQALDVPRSNVELFRKHEADIKKYAMQGLAFVGL